LFEEEKKMETHVTKLERAAVALLLNFELLWLAGERKSKEETNEIRLCVCVLHCVFNPADMAPIPETKVN
jgi:hypothetical protein